MNYDNKITEAHSCWVSTMNEINSVFNKSDKVYKDYMSLFQAQENRITKNSYVTSCLWLGETRYLSIILYLHSLLVSATTLLKNIWETLKSLETQRIESVKVAIEEFLTLHSTIFKQNIDEVAEVLKDVPVDTIEINGVLGEEESKILREEFGEDMFESLINWKLESPPRSNLVVKQGYIERETAVFKVWKGCYAVLTVDRFLHIFNEDPNKVFYEPMNTCFLIKATIIENEELYFEIIEAKQLGILSKLSAPRRSVFKLNNLQDFLDWIRTIRTLT
jgi:PH domain